MQLWGIFLPWLLLIRPCIHIGNILDSINTIQTNQLSMAYYPEASVIFQYLTPTIPYHMLIDQRKLNVQLQSIVSPEVTSIPNISSTSCLFTATFKGSMYPLIATLLYLNFLDNMGFTGKHLHCRQHKIWLKGHP